MKRLDCSDNYYPHSNDYINHYKIEVFLLFCGLLSFVVFLVCNSYFSNGQLDVLSFFVWGSSLAITSLSIIGILKNGIKIYSLFFLLWFLLIHIDSYKLCALQNRVTIVDIYYWYTGALILGGLFYLAENARIGNTVVPRGRLNIEQVTWLLVMIYILLNIKIIMTNGVKIFEVVFNGAARTQEFGIAGYSGLKAMLNFVLLMQFPHVKKMTRIAIALVTIFFDGILQYSRHGFVQTAVFIALFYFYIKGRELFKQRTLLWVVTFLLLFSIVFIVLGNIRQAIHSHIDTREVIDGLNSIMNVSLGGLIWLYGYSVVNFDVLKKYYSYTPDYSFQTLLSPLLRIAKAFFPNVVEPSRHLTFEQIYGFHGFNASTFLSNYIMDMGILFWLEIAVLGMIYSAFIIYSRKYDFKGLYIMIMYHVLLLVFGDYMSASYVIFAIITSMILYRFCRNQRY